MGLNAFLKAPQLRRRGIPQDRSYFDGKIRPSSGERSPWANTTLQPMLPPSTHCCHLLRLPHHLLHCCQNTKFKESAPKQGMGLRRSTWTGHPEQPDALTPRYPVMLRAGSTESKQDVAKASGPVQNSLIQAYIVCVSDSLFSQHLGTLTLICV